MGYFEIRTGENERIDISSFEKSARDIALEFRSVLTRPVFGLLK